MSPLFGRNDDNHADKAARQVEVDRLDSRPLPELAAEVMGKAFGPGGQGEAKDNTVTVGGPNITAGVTVGAIAEDFVPGDADEELRIRRDRLVAEGIQALEHASLVRGQLHTAMGGLDYTVTRLGRAALERNSAAPVVGGGSL